MQNNLKKLAIAVCVFAVGPLPLFSMPTAKEIEKVQGLVNDVTASGLKAMKSGAKKPAEVAADQVALAKEAESEAERYLLLQSAFKIYVKDGSYDSAADVLETLNRQIKDMDPKAILEIYNKSIFRSFKESAPRLFAIKAAARRKVYYGNQVEKLEAIVKINPKDVVSQKKLGENYAQLGDWNMALASFEKAGGDLARLATDELQRRAAPLKIGDFWWDYSSDDVYRLHAAEHYRVALAVGSLTGLARARVEQRVEEAEKLNVAVGGGGDEVVSNRDEGGMYCVMTYQKG